NDPSDAQHYRLRERAARIDAEPLESHVRRPTAQARPNERGLQLRGGVAPQPRALDFAKAHVANSGERALQVLRQVLAQAPELQSDGSIERGLDLGTLRHGRSSSSRDGRAEAAREAREKLSARLHVDQVPLTSMPANS